MAQNGGLDPQDPKMAQNPEIGGFRTFFDLIFHMALQYLFGPEGSKSETTF